MENNLNLLPTAIKISAKTISQDLIEVVPLSSPYNSSSEIEKIENEVKSINRNNKINSILKGVTYKKMNVNEHHNYKDTMLYHVNYKWI